MIIGEAEGIRFRFEVVESVDGFAVRRAAIEAEDWNEDAEILFRTAPAAFAYAEMAACQDCVDAGEGDGCGAAPDEVASWRLSIDRFTRLRADLADHGVSGSLLVEWDRAEARERERQVH
jgi:hypothetical protein